MTTKNNTLGSELREAREVRKLSLRNVEDATGISNAYLSQLENDKVKKPSPHFLNKLAKLYEIDFVLVMEKAGYIDRKDKPDENTPKTLAGAVLFSQGNLSREEEEELVSYLQYLRNRKQK
jgi:HTH-type transcriptional regulator, competence development regulator